MLTIVTILLVSGIGALLALLLVIAERVITNYGDVTIDINKGKKSFTVRGGGTLLGSLGAEKIFIPSACGGRGTCGYCRVKVTAGAGPFLPTEEPYINSRERAEGIRLSCQVKVRNNLSIEIPGELFAIKEFNCLCEKIIDLTHDIKQFNLKLVKPDTMEYMPGQYIQLRTPRYDNSTEEVYRAYSLSSDPADKHRIELIIRRVPGGICTTYLFDHLREKDQVAINGPYGKFYLRDTDAPIVFVAGGSGIAPIKSILHHMKNTGNKRNATFFFGVHKPPDLFLVDEMKQFEKTIPNFSFVPVISDPGAESTWTGAVGRVTEAVKQYLAEKPDAARHEGYLCGSPGMINAAVAILLEAGIPRERHYYDKFQ